MVSRSGFYFLIRRTVSTCGVNEEKVHSFEYFISFLIHCGWFIVDIWLVSLSSISHPFIELEFLFWYIIIIKQMIILLE
jgi:hypothetical protein